jgi:hypothetical protein
MAPPSGSCRGDALRLALAESHWLILWTWSGREMCRFLNLRTVGELYSLHIRLFSIGM